MTVASNFAGTFQKFSPAVRPVRHNSCLGEIKFSPSGLLPETNQAAARILGSYPFHTGFWNPKRAEFIRGSFQKRSSGFFEGSIARTNFVRRVLLCGKTMYVGRVNDLYWK